jgi:hypothetical protein
MAGKHRNRHNVRWVAWIAGATMALSSVPAFALPAFADSYNGVLGIHGVGSVFAGTDASGLDGGAFVSRSVSAGGTASFALEVVNTGTALSQYQVNLAADGVSVPTLTAGSTNVTSLALAPAPHGYETTPIAPTKTLALTFKVTVPKTALPTDQFMEALTLWGPGQDVYLGTVYVTVQVASSTANSANTILGTANSQSAVRGSDSNGQRPWVTAATIKGTSTATFTLTLKNGSTLPATLTLDMTPVFACSQGSFVTTVKIGSTDITTAAFSDAGYTLPVLAKGSSKTVTVAVKSLAPAPDLSYCANVQAFTADVTADGSQFNGVNLIANAV